MWRRFKGHNQTPQPDESQEDIAESNNQPISDNRTSKEVEVSSKKKYQLPGTAQFPSKNSKNKRKSLRMEDKSADNTTKSQGTSTSKKSFWRARKLSSPTTKRSKEQRQSSRTSSKKSNIEFSTKSRKSSSSQNSNPIYLETLGANVTERKIEAETQSDTNFKSSKLTSRHSLKKNANNHDINKTTSTSANHPFEAIVVPDDLAELKNQNREYNREIKTARPYIVDQTILPRQYSTPANSSQQTVVTTARSISTPADHSITAVHINDRNGGDPLHRHSIGSNKRPGRITSRFSLRRLFYGNNIAQPAIFRTLGTRASIEIAAASKTARFVEDNQSDTKSTVWRDNTSSCSSLQGGATAAISLGGNSTAASLMVHAGGSASSTVLKECPLCLSECTLDLFPLLRNCHHLFCIDCLQTYVKIEIQEGRVNLRCPQCTELMHPNDIETLIGDKNSNLLTLYESLMLRRLLAVDPDTRWCPGPNCTYAVIAAGCASCPKITCERPGCGYSFCYHCKAEWHPNQTCDAARAQRNQNQGTMIGSALPMALRSSSGTFSLEAINAAGGAVPGSAAGVINGSMGVPSNSGQTSEVKVCPRCNTLIVKMDDGSCNHMTCPVCGAEFCWLCMKEISDLHYLSPSGCTFWGKKPWSRKKKLLWQLGTLVGAPVGIALLAGIAVPAMIIGIPSWVGRKIHDHYKHKNKHKRNLAVVGGVISSLVISPFLAGLAVSIGVPILLCYVYGVVPIALCRSEGCGVYTTVSGVRIDIDEDDIDMANAASQLANAVMNAGENAAASFRNMKSGNSGANQASLNESRNIDANSENRKTLNIGSSRGHRNQDLVANPSIGEVSLGASLSLGSGCHLNEREQYTDLASRECDRESASNTAVAGASLTGSLASSYLGARNHDHSTITNSQRQEDTHKSGINPPATMMSGIGTYHLQNRLEVDVHNGSRKKFSFSSERLSDQISLSERSGTISMGDGDGARSEASTRALAGSLLAYKLGDSQSVSSYQRVIGERSIGDPTSETTSNVVPASSSSMGYGATSAAGMHEDALSLRSLPLHAAGVHGRVAGADIYPSVAKEQHLQNPSSSIVSVVPPRSLSPVSSMSGDELSYVPTAMSYVQGGNNLVSGAASLNQHQGGSKRFSRRPRAMLDKQLSENSSLLGEGDTISERVRFDDNVSFIDADSDYINAENRNTKSEVTVKEDVRKSENVSEMTKNELTTKSSECYIYSNATEVSDDAIATTQRPIKGSTIIDTSCTVTEETAEELAQVVSPPIIRSQITSSELFHPTKRDNFTTENTFEKAEMRTECVVVTTTGSSIVNVNQQSSSKRDSVHAIEKEEDPSLSRPSNTDVKSISKPDASVHESRRHDHITLLSVGGTSDTQFITKNS